MNVSFCIRKIDSKTAMAIIVKNHYSRRTVGAKHCYGLFASEDLVGCIVYSQPASYTLCKGVCGQEYSKHVLELSRLVVLTNEKNAASFLIAASLKKLGNAVVVSYADCNEHVGHVGYVYQATNWIYTGQGNAEPVWLHPETGDVISYTRRHIDKKAQALGFEWTDLKKKQQVGKHRYVTFCGTKGFKKKAKQNLKYKQHPYPKGPSRRHQIESNTDSGLVQKTFSLFT